MLNDGVCISYHGSLIHIFVSRSHMSISALEDRAWILTQVCSSHAERGEGWKESTVPMTSRSANQKKRSTGLVEIPHSTQEREVFPGIGL